MQCCKVSCIGATLSAMAFHCIKDVAQAITYKQSSVRAWERLLGGAPRRPSGPMGMASGSVSSTQAPGASPGSPSPSPASQSTSSSSSSQGPGSLSPSSAATPALASSGHSARQRLVLSQHLKHHPYVCEFAILPAYRVDAHLIADYDPQPSIGLMHGGSTCSAGSISRVC